MWMRNKRTGVAWAVREGTPLHERLSKDSGYEALARKAPECPEPDTDAGLESKSKAELVTLATERGLEGVSTSMTKAEIIEALRG